MRISSNFNPIMNAQNAQNQNDNNRTFRMNRDSERRVRQARASGRRDFAAERRAAQEHELQLRESEEARILKINEQMNLLAERRISLGLEIDHVAERMITLKREQQRNEALGIFAEPVDFANMSDSANEIFDYLANGEERLEDLELQLSQTEATMDSLSSQIAQIHAARAERERIAMEREFARMQEEMEERIRERERIAEEQQENRTDRTEEELEADAQSSTVRSLLTADARMQDIRSLSRTRAQLQASATRMEGEARFDRERTRIANAEIEAHVARQNVQAREEYIAARAAAEEDPDLPVPRRTEPLQAQLLYDRNPLSPDGFRGRHLARLNGAIAGLDASINRSVAALYRDSQRLQESQLRVAREMAEAESESDDDNNEENQEKIINYTL
ncbi:MAG: hypothetical protein FWF77_09440 [Defluviitaleaceae bacterium]|nr:hypothetical protein [Defluviitaleaceae bacterium]